MVIWNFKLNGKIFAGEFFLFWEKNHSKFNFACLTKPFKIIKIKGELVAPRFSKNLY